MEELMGRRYDRTFRDLVHKVLLDCLDSVLVLRLVLDISAASKQLFAF
jgi:hypothetical protein